MKIKYLDDMFPIASELTKEEEVMCRKHNIPCFKGVLSKRVDDFGKEIFIAENTVVIGGAVAALEALFFGDITGKSGSNVSYYRGGNTLNEMINMTNKDNHIDISAGDKSIVGYFGVGLYGAGSTFGDVNTPNFKNNALDNGVSYPNVVPISGLETGLLPIRCRVSAPSASETEYHATVTKAITGTSGENTYYCSYLKEFSANIVVDDQDSSPDDASYGDGDAYKIKESSGLIEAYAKCTIELTTSDIREYFVALGAEDQARFNSIGLFMGAYNSTDKDLRDIRLFSYVNFNNEPLVEETESTYIYRVYAAI